MWIKASSFCLLFILASLNRFAGAQTLPEAVKQTLQNHPEIRAETSRYHSRVAELEQAQSGYLPNVDLSAGIGYERSDNAATRADGKDHRELTRKEAALTVDQMLFDGYAVSSEIARQQARVESQRQTADGSGELLALRTVESYLQVLLNRRLTQLSASNLQIHDRILDQVGLRSRAGVGRRSDLEQVKGRRAAAVASLLSDQVNLRDAESGFLAVVGDLPRELAQVDAPTQNLPATLDLALQRALERHPILKSAKADVSAAEAQHKAAGNAFYPKLNLELGGRWDDDLDGVKGRDHDLTAMLRMRYNLYAGGRDRARYRQTLEMINEAKDIRDRARRQVIEGLRLAWSAYQVTREQKGYQQRHIDAAERTRDAYAKQFRLGQRTLLDLLNTEDELFQARRSFQSTQKDHLLAQYRILGAMGELMEQLGLSRPTMVEERDAAEVRQMNVAADSAVDAEIRAQRARFHNLPTSSSAVNN